MDNIFLFELFAVLFVIISMGYLSLVWLKKASVQNYFIRNQSWLHPNKISSYRLYSGVPFAFLVFYGIYTENNILLGITIPCLTLFAMTDLLDGKVAQYCKLQTNTGKKLDALADKYFDIPILFGLVIGNTFFSFIVFIIFISDCIGTYLRKFLQNSAAQQIGKIKTTCKFFSIGGLYIFERCNITSQYNIYLNIFLLGTLLFSVASTGEKIYRYYQKS
ncbi:MAG: CDP-alcohol phosphatidyltransferase family protein [Candidatus Gracilibacteria bacterium]|nr:CDP-alcohol phosphatidyltransferase family protein [Candidatus Gracilibacteria bacterium]